jgi:N-acetylneuraminic acid mutarotase
MRPLSAIAIFILLGFPIVAQADFKPIWEELNPMPEGRSGMIAFPLNQSEPAFYGGSSWNDGEKRIHASGYVLHDHQWLPLVPLPTPTAYAAVAAEDHLLHVAGGTNGNQLNRIRFTQHSNLRQQFFKLPPPQTRLYAGAALLNGAYYQIGGSTQLSPLAPTNSISKSEGDAWKDLGPLPEGPLINSAVATWKNRIFVFGGGLPGPNGLENTDSVFAFNTSDDSWEKQVPLPIAARGAVATSFPDIGILLVGGYTGSNRATPQVLLYDPEKNEFRSLPELPEGLMLPAVVLTDHSIYVFGGEDAPKHRSANVFRTDIRRLLENPTVQP